MNEQGKKNEQKKKRFLLYLFLGLIVSLPHSLPLPPMSKRRLERVTLNKLSRGPPFFSPNLNLHHIRLCSLSFCSLHCLSVCLAVLSWLSTVLLFLPWVLLDLTFFYFFSSFLSFLFFSLLSRSQLLAGEFDRGKKGTR